MNTQTKDLPPLPKPDTHCFDEDTRKDCWSYSATQMHAYALEAIRASATSAPEQPANQAAEATIERISAVCSGPDAQPSRYDIESIFADQSAAAYKASGGKTPWTYLSAGERSKWQTVALAVCEADPRDMIERQQ